MYNLTKKAFLIAVNKKKLAIFCVLTIFNCVTKQIFKSKAPEEVFLKVNPSTISDFCEVYIPMAPAIFTYGVPNGITIVRGQVVWVQFAKRKKPLLEKPLLAIIKSVFKDKPKFDVRLAYPHCSNYIFSERYIETLEWCARYYMTTPNKALSVFLPTKFENYLDALAFYNANAMQETVQELPQKLQTEPLTTEQTAALNALVCELSHKGFRGVLLHGVTGSGKTRIYQELAYEALKQKKKVLILVPEIALTPQTAARIQSFLQVPIVVLHSALSAPKKREGYVSILNNNAQVVLGTRSAILAPFNFDLIILDEEHDSSYKQQEPSPRYHTRELAYHIAYKYNALVVLGSATPSLETFFNAQKSNLKIIQLKTRATKVPLPKVQIVDMTKNRQQKGIMLSHSLREALVACISNGFQAIILMNRRGYSKSRVCSKCGETLYCKQCHIPLVYHKQYNSLMCHYCATLYPLNTKCLECGSDTYEFVGGAIEKLEEEIVEWIPNAKVVRMDRDTTQNIGAIEKILDAFRNKEFNVLLGTQMVAKGHDFPSVQLVGVVGADIGLGLPDFRATERLFQLLSQTAGRAGRANDNGLVLIQTLKPTEPIMQFAINHDYNGFAKKELDDRRLALYPPFCKLVEISCGSKDSIALTNAIEKIAQLCRLEKSAIVLGPVDAMVSIVQNVHWAKLYIKVQNMQPIRKILEPIVNANKPWAKGVDIKIEID